MALQSVMINKMNEAQRLLLANWIGFYGEQAEKYAEDNYKEWKVKMDIVRANAKKNVEANGCHQRGEV